MASPGLQGFKTGERVIVHAQTWGRANRRGVVLGAEPGGAIVVRVEREPEPVSLAAAFVFHDTSAFYTWLDAEIPPSGDAPAPPGFGRRRTALAALQADNPHLMA